GLPTPPSSRPSAQAGITARRSITPFASCCGNVGLLTGGGGAGRGFMTCGTPARCIGWRSGIAKGPTSTPCSPSWPRTSATRASPSPSSPGGSPPTCSPTSPPGPRRPSATSSPGGPYHETDRPGHASDGLLDRLPAGAAPCQPQHYQGLPGCLRAAAPLLPRR